MVEKDVKSCFNFKKLIPTSERHAEHPFAGRNTQKAVSIRLGTTGLVLSRPFDPSIVFHGFRRQRISQNLLHFIVSGKNQFIYNRTEGEKFLGYPLSKNLN